MTELNDWTYNPKTRRENDSEAFEDAVAFVARVLANLRFGDTPEHAARLLVAQLAHVKGFGPNDDVLSHRLKERVARE